MKLVNLPRSIQLIIDGSKATHNIMTISLLLFYISESCEDFYFRSPRTNPKKLAKIYTALRTAQVRITYQHIASGLHFSTEACT